MMFGHWQEKLMRPIIIKTLDEVYAPREDSYLFVDHLSHVTKFHPQTVLEIGCGSGVIILNLLNSYSSAVFYAIDVNFSAAQLTLENSKTNGFDNLQIITGLDFHPFRKNSFDMVVFNPPYLPNDDLNAKFTDLENLQYVGGEHGYESLLSLLQSHKAYFKRCLSMISSLSISLDDFDRLIPDFEVTKVSELKLSFETLWLILLEEK